MASVGVAEGRERVGREILMEVISRKCVVISGHGVKQLGGKRHSFEIYKESKISFNKFN